MLLVLLLLLLLLLLLPVEDIAGCGESGEKEKADTCCRAKSRARRPTTRRLRRKAVIVVDTTIRKWPKCCSKDIRLKDFGYGR